MEKCQAVEWFGVVFGGSSYDTCKVTFVANMHEQDSKYLDGKYIKLTELYNDHDDDINCHLQNYQKYGFVHAVVVSSTDGDKQGSISSCVM